VDPETEDVTATAGDDIRALLAYVDELRGVVTDLTVSVRHGAYFCQCGVPEGNGLTHGPDGLCPYCIGERGLRRLEEGKR
jgi:hypothetical protein